MTRSTSIVHVPKANLARRETTARLEEALWQLWASLESPESRRGYRSDWGRYLQWLTLEGVEVLEARPHHVQKYVLSMREAGKAKATRGRALSVVREVYAALCRAELIPMNPAREVKNPRVDAQPSTPWLDQAGLQKLLDALPPATSSNWYERRDRLCILLLVGLGKRRAEIARLRVGDFENGGREVVGVVKRGKSTRVGVPAWLQEEVAAWLSELPVNPPGEYALLPRAPDEPYASISGDQVHDIVRAAAKRAGLSITPHGLRRSFITILGKMGVSLKERQLAVAHESGSTTERYDRAREAAENAPGELFGEMVKKARKE